MNRIKQFLKERRINKRYITIIAVLAVLFLIFQVVSNFAQFMMDKNQQLSVMEHIDYKTLLTLEQQKKSDQSVKTPFCLVLGEEGQTAYDITKRQLENLGEACRGVKELPSSLEGIQGIFLCREELTKEERQVLTSALRENIPLYFMVMPDSSLLKDEEMQNILGILEYKGYGTHKGIRFVEDFFNSGMLEMQKTKVDMAEVSLRQGTKTYAYSLMEEVKKDKPDNESLFPVIWRNMYLEEGMGQGTQVYCINGKKLMESAEGFGILTAVLSSAVKDYIYPVINAYGFFIRDFPFLSNFSNDRIEMLYSRDAIGVQQDILLPAITGYCRKYGVKAACFSPDAQEIRSSDEKRPSYYRKEILSQVGEIAFFDPDTGRMDAREYPLQCVPWTAEFDFGEEEKSLQVPLIQNGADDFEKNELLLETAETAFGFMSVYTDVEDILSEESESSWVDIAKNLDTLLRVQEKSMGYLERMTVSDCAKRIKLYQVQQMTAEKSDHGMELTIKYFGGAAYYILKTDREIAKVENGSAKYIGNGRYLITAGKSRVEIVYQQR